MNLVNTLDPKDHDPVHPKIQQSKELFKSIEKSLLFGVDKYLMNRVYLNGEFVPWYFA